MNFSRSPWISNESECTSFFPKTVSLQYSSTFDSTDSSDGLLVAAAVLNLVVCPFTILLNALVMIAVKTRRRLQTHPNILLACLALTDLMVGLVVQPLHITKTIFLLQGKSSHEFCDIELAFTLCFMILTFATLSHLLLISGERYIAIKHTFTHATVVSKARLIISSALVWIAAMVFFIVISYLPIAIFTGFTAIIFSIVVLQIFVYKEACRHEKHIFSQQVSVETRAKFNQEKKALKLTRIILLTIFLCLVLPLFSMFLAGDVFRETSSPNVKTLVRHLGHVPVIINSVLNTVIYTVKKRQFRVAFIELLLRKRLQEAEEFHRRLFSSRNIVAGQQTGQENAENTSHEHHPKEPVSAAGANFIDKNTTSTNATQNSPVSSNEHTSTSEKLRGRNTEHVGERNFVHDIKGKQENGVDVLVLD